jgi:proteasome accessory factor B
MVLLVRAGAASPLRRAADIIETDVPGPDDASGWDRLVLTRGTTDMAEEVLGYGPAVCVESPQWLRDQVVARLRGVSA